jgi:hypothetical protein
MATIKLTNKTSRVLHLNLGDSKQFVLPPTATDVAVRLDVDPGKEQRRAARIYNALTTSSVRRWVERGWLTIEGDLKALEPAAKKQAKEDAERREQERLERIAHVAHVR